MGPDQPLKDDGCTVAGGKVGGVSSEDPRQGLLGPHQPLGVTAAADDGRKGGGSVLSFGAWPMGKPRLGPSLWLRSDGIQRHPKGTFLATVKAATLRHAQRNSKHQNPIVPGH